MKSVLIHPTTGARRATRRTVLAAAMTSRRRRPVGVARLLLGSVVGALALIAVLVVANPASASPADITASPSNIIVTWAVSGGDGSSQANAIVYTVTVDDCSKEPTVFLARRVQLNSVTRADDLGKWFTIGVTCSAGFTAGTTDITPSFLPAGPVTRSTPAGTPSPVDNDSMTFQLLPNSSVPSGAGFSAGFSIRSASDKQNLAIVVSFDPVGVAGGGDSSTTVASTPVLIGGVVPEVSAGQGVWQQADGTSTPLVASSPAAGQLRYEAEGVRVTLTGTAASSPARGLVADPAGEIVCEVCVAAAAGQVIEVWLFSTPRLVAAHRIDDTECHLLAIPLSAPLDGGGPVSAGAHTLQLAIPTSSGMQAVNVGVTVGGPVPASVPAGEGSVPFGAVLLLLLAAAGALFAGRRLVTAG